ncbi:MAG: MFS transporter, partial [Oscillospiraceae bacterium]|nr:MFS transporter [Oscillospiraceae bacterium]
MANLGTQVKKYVSNNEFIAFLACAFFFANMQGMVGNFRQKYLVDVLGLANESVSAINFICNAAGFALPFFYAMLADRAPKPGKAKFKPMVLMAAVPAGIFSVLMFIAPSALSELSVIWMIAYQCTVTLLYNASIYFAGTFNYIAYVISPEHSERDRVLSFRGISSAIGNSAPLVVVMAIGLLKKPGIISGGEAMTYLLSSVLCALASTLTLLFAMRVLKERIAYSSEKENPLLGFRDVLRNRHALLVLLSEFIKGFRAIASYMGVFLAAALLGDASKFLLLGLPTGIGTF